MPLRRNANKKLGPPRSVHRNELVLQCDVAGSRIVIANTSASSRSGRNLPIRLYLAPDFSDRPAGQLVGLVRTGSGAVAPVFVDVVRASRLGGRARSTSRRRPRASGRGGTARDTALRRRGSRGLVAS